MQLLSERQELLPPETATERPPGNRLNDLPGDLRTVSGPKPNSFRARHSWSIG